MLGQIRPQETLPPAALQVDTLALQVDIIPQAGTEEAMWNKLAVQPERAQQAGHYCAHLVLDRVDAKNTSDEFVKATHDSS